MSNIVEPILRLGAPLVVGTGAYLIACAWAPSASGQTPQLCDGLKVVTAQTSKQYVELRGSFDSVWDAYVGTVVLGSLTECRTSSQGNSAEYACRQHLPDDPELARRSLEALNSSVKACFGKDVKVMKALTPADNWTRLRNVIGGESISLRFQQHAPKDKRMSPYYVLTLEISTRELNEK